LNALATLYWRGAEVDRAEAVAEEALAVNRAIESPIGVAWSLISLGMIAYFQGRSALAVARLEEGVPYARLGGYNVLLSLALTFLARTVMRVNGPSDPYATAVLEESLAVAEASRSRTALGYALITSGDAAWRHGSVERALGMWRRALVMRWELADRRGVADSIERLAWGLAATQQFSAAAWLFGAGDAQRSTLAIELRNDEQPDHVQLETATRQHLGDAFASAWSAGHGATAEEAVRRALLTDGVLRESNLQR
jgi:hypothetical protein